MNKFYIDTAYLKSVVTRQTYYLRREYNESDQEFLIKKLKNPGPVMTSTGVDDHPQFKDLRDRLDQMGFIRTQRNSWNGDYVIKQFYLNDVKFKEGQRFLSAPAVKYTLENAKASL